MGGETGRAQALPQSPSMEDAERMIRLLRAGLEDAILCLESWGDVIPRGEKDRYGYEEDLLRLREIQGGQYEPWWAHARMALVPNGEQW